jgi:hypothetical protein
MSEDRSSRAPFKGRGLGGALGFKFHIEPSTGVISSQVFMKFFIACDTIRLGFNDFPGGYTWSVGYLLQTTAQRFKK